MEGPSKSLDGIQPPKPLSEVVPKSVDAVRARERTSKPTTQEKPSWLKDFLVGKDLKRGLDATEPTPEEVVEPERTPIEEQIFQGNTGGVGEKETVTAEVREVNEEPLPEELIDQAREEAEKEIEKESTETVSREPERLPVEEQMVQVRDSASPGFEETSASGASTEGLQESEEVTEQESKDIVRDEAWKEIRENYKAYRAQVKDAEAVFLEASKKYEEERRGAGMLRRFIATPELDNAKQEMLQAQYTYDNLLEGLRGHRQERMEYFVKEQLSKKSKDDALTEYVARHETMLEHHIDNEVQLLEGLRYQENEKGESRYKLVRGSKAFLLWYRKLPLKKRALYGAGLAGLAGLGAGALGWATAGALATGGAMAARKGFGTFFGGFAALETKRYGDKKSEEFGERALKKQHESFKETSLRQSREDRRAIQRDVRLKKKVSSVAAVGAAMAAGGVGSIAGGEAYEAVFGNSSSSGIPQDFKEKSPEPIEGKIPKPGTVDTHMPESGDVATFSEKDIHFGGVDIKVPEGSQEDVHFGGVDIKVPEGSQEDVHFGGVDIKVPEPESGDIATLPEDEIKKYSSAEEASLVIPKSAVDAYSAKPDIAELLQKLGIGEEASTDTQTPPLKDVPPYEIPKNLNEAPLEPTPDVSKIISEKGVTLKGVYEAGSSVEGELQDFLENDTWVKKTYPNLTDVERGKIAHLIQQEIEKDPNMMRDFNIKGEDWHKVKVNGVYEATLDKDLLSTEIEKIHGHKSVPVEVTPPVEKPPVSLPLEDATKPEVKDVPEPTKEAPPMTIKEDLAHAKEQIGPDYHGAATRPALADLFKEGYFQGSVLQGQRSLIMSYWGPMSHVRMEDIFDKSKSLTYTIDNKPPVTMGAGVEALTYNLVDKLEHSLQPKIPNVADIIEQSVKNNDTLGELINKLHLRLEEVEPFRPKLATPPDNLPTAEPIPEPVTVPKNTAVPESKPDTAVPESKTTLPEVERIPLAKYEAPKVGWNTDPVYGTRAVAKLPPIEVTPEITKLVEIKYPTEEPEWRSLTAHQFFNSENNHTFRDMVHAQLTDIAVALKGASDTPLAKFSIDWSAYDGMKPKDVMLQLEQHEAMLKKLHPNAPEGQVIETKKF